MTLGCDRRQPQKPADGHQSGSAAKPSQEASPPKAGLATGQTVLEHMVAAYRAASTYADNGAVHLLVESDGRTIIDQKSPFSVVLRGPISCDCWPIK